MGTSGAMATYLQGEPKLLDGMHIVLSEVSSRRARLMILSSNPKVYASATNQLNDPDAVQHDDGSAEQEEKKDDEEEEQEQPTFEQIYMRQITNVLAEELTELKEQENLEDETRITQLVDCLQMGMNFYSELEKDLCVQGWSRENSNNKKKAAKTKGLHQALQELY